MLKFRYFIQLSFAGTNYHGWQSQRNGISVQQVLNEKLSMKIGESVELTGAGRTDTGVHASFYIAHFDCSKKLDQAFVHKMNSFLPNDISIQKIIPVHPDAHARFNATLRTYQYKISKCKDPFSHEFTQYYLSKLNLDKMNEAAGYLLKISDFTSFSKLHGNNKTNICSVTFARWEENEKMIVFTITANRFLRNMVRAIVGTLLDVGKGKLSVDEFIRIAQDKNRQKAGSSAPAKGLFLTNIEYPESVYLHPGEF